MKSILILTIILNTLFVVSKAQGLLGSTKATIIDSMKNKDAFNQGTKHGEDGSFILTYINFMHKDGTFKLNDDYQLVSTQFEIKNDRCIMMFYTYKDELLDKYITTYNTNTDKYQKNSDYEWTDKKNNLLVKLTQLTKQKFFMIEYELLQ